MASLATTKTGKREIHFRGVDEKRRTLRLGEMPTKVAQTVLHHVEQILGAQAAKAAVPFSTSSWLGELPDTLHDRLARCGLPESRVDEKTAAGPLLAAFIDEYTRSRTDVKPATQLNYAKSRKRLIEFFGVDRPIRDITSKDADQWQAWLRTQVKQDNTVRSLVKNAKVFFRQAVVDGLLEKSPFGHLKSMLKVRRDRMAFISIEDTRKLLDAAPSAEWRALIGLCRFGGLRCPSETLSLKWSDINWAAGRMRIEVPKLAHIEGRDERISPLWPEFRDILWDWHELSPNGSEFVIEKYRDVAKNMRTAFDRIIRRAGLKPWPRRFQNLRSSRETELAAAFPIQCVTSWLGNSPKIALSNYLQVRDSDFEQAAAFRRPAEESLPEIGPFMDRGWPRLDVCGLPGWRSRSRSAMAPFPFLHPLVTSSPW